MTDILLVLVKPLHPAENNKLLKRQAPSRRIQIEVFQEIAVSLGVAFCFEGDVGPVADRLLPGRNWNYWDHCYMTATPE